LYELTLLIIVNVETSGIIPAEQIFLSALDVFMDKIKDIQPLVDRVVSNELN
jgi:DNA-directed RNA polymerase I and III subunit RPAC1